MDEDLVDCPSSNEFHLPGGIEYLIGYNIDYDWRVIGEPPIKRICVLALARSLLPGLDSYSQSAVLYHLIRSQARELLKGAHSADADVYNCRIILSHLIPKLAPIEPTGAPLTWYWIWLASEQARIPKVMTFGKHKGVAINDIPADYKCWLLGQPDVDPYLVKALRGEAA
jgi:exodeoxyribonuclease X